MSSARLLHISDLHARPALADQAQVLDGAVEDLVRLHSESPIDAVIFSGDLSYSGQDEEFELARRLLIDPLLDALDLPLERLVLVPGNHDVDRGAIEPFQEKGLRDTLVDNESVGNLLEDVAMVR